METCRSHEGHRVLVRVVPGLNGRWSWSFQIDGGPTTSHLDCVLLGEDAAAEAAFRAARHKIASARTSSPR